MILKSKATFEEHVKIGAMIEVYQKTSLDKKGIWSTPKGFLKVDHDARSLIVPGKAGKHVTVAFEDVRKTISEESFAHAVQQTIDSIDKTVEDEAQETSHEVTETVESGLRSHIEMCAAGEDNDADFSKISEVTAPGNVNENVNRGDRVEVYWPIDRVYYPGVVQTMHCDGCVTIQYDDGGSERLNMENEVWKMQSSTGRAAVAQNGKTLGITDVSKKIVDVEPAELEKLYVYFW